MKYFILFFFVSFSFSQKSYLFDVNQHYKNNSLKKGLEELQNNQYNKASTSFLKALSYDSKDYKLRYFLGLSFYFQGKFSKAINEWNNIIKLGGQDKILIQKINLLKNKITENNKKIIYSFDDYRYSDSYPKDNLYKFKKYKLNTLLSISKDDDNNLFFLEYKNNIFGSLDKNGKINNIYFSSFVDQLKSIVDQQKKSFFYDFVILDKNKFLFTDFQNNQILKYENQILSTLIQSSSTNLIYGPQNIFVDENKNIFFSDIGRSMIYCYNDKGKYLYSFSVSKSEKNKIVLINGLLYSKKYKRIYVSDKKNKTIKVFDKFGSFIEDIKHYSFNSLGSLSFYNHDENKIAAVVKNNVVIYDLLTKKHNFLIKNKNKNFLPQDIFFDSQKNLYIANGSNIDIYSPDKKNILDDQVFVKNINTSNFPYIKLKVSVLNKDNKPIEDLTSKNFSIEENNTKRSLIINKNQNNIYYTTIIFPNNYQTYIRKKKMKKIFNFFYKEQSSQDKIKVIQVKEDGTDQIEDFSQNRLSVVNQFDQENFLIKKQTKTLNLKESLEKIIMQKTVDNIKNSILLIIDKPYNSLNFFYPEIKKYLYQANVFNISIHILYIGQKFSDSYFLDLQKITKITEGKFFYYNGLESLQKVLNIIKNRTIDTYSITYLSSIKNKEIGTFRKVNVKLKYQQRQANDSHMGYLIPWRFKFSNSK